MNQASVAPRPAIGSEAVSALIDAHVQMPGGLLPLLHALQDVLGHIPAELVPQIASALNLSRAEVHGVISYYHHFRSEPARGTLVQICRAEACQACGADDLWAHAVSCEAQHPITVEAVHCLGLCATAPAMSLGDRPVARVTPTKFDRLMAGLKERS